jgi:hypothetical protein
MCIRNRMPTAQLVLAAFAAALVLFAGCSASPGKPATPSRKPGAQATATLSPADLGGLRRFLRAGQTTAHCVGPVRQSPPGSICLPSRDIVTDLEATDNGQRLAVLYLDGHIAVWDLRHDALLLSLPPAPTQAMWLTGGGSVLAREVGSLGSGTNLVQIWPVGRRPMARRPEAEFRLSTDFLWQNPQASRMLILPNFNAIQPPSNRRGVPPIILYDPLRRRTIATAGAPKSAVNGFPQPPVIAADTATFDKTTGTFVITSEEQMGFITWKPGSQPIATKSNCEAAGTLTSDGRLFACPAAAPAQAVAIWNVPQRQEVALLQPGNTAAIQVSSVAFLDGDRMIAVAVARQPPAPYVIQLYRLSDHQLVRSFLLQPAPTQYYPASLWVVGSTLVAEQDTGKYACGPLSPRNQPCASRYFVFPLNR